MAHGLVVIAADTAASSAFSSGSAVPEAPWKTGTPSSGCARPVTVKPACGTTRAGSCAPYSWHATACARNHRGPGHPRVRCRKMCAARRRRPCRCGSAPAHAQRTGRTPPHTEKGPAEQHAARLWTGHRHERIVQLQRIVHIVHGAFLQPVHGACAEMSFNQNPRAECGTAGSRTPARVLVGRAQQMRPRPARRPSYRG